jgi:hypothetical protein
MTTNTHILTINDRLVSAVHIVRGMQDSEEKKALIDLLEDAIDHLMETNTDMANAVRKVEIFSEHMSQLSQSIYAPVMSAQMTFPSEGDYNGVREYIENRKQRDEIFKNYCNNHTRKQLCARLSDEFGWTVDENSYGQNLRRH